MTSGFSFLFNTILLVPVGSSLDKVILCPNVLYILEFDSNKCVQWELRSSSTVTKNVLFQQMLGWLGAYPEKQ